MVQWRFIFAFPLFMHGLAHFSGFLASWTSAEAGYADQPWVFSKGVRLKNGLGRLFGLLWLVAALGLVASALGLFLLQPWWPTLAVASALVSLLVIVPWWNTVPPGAKIGALFDLLVLVVLLTPLQARWLALIG